MRPFGGLECLAWRLGRGWTGVDVWAVGGGGQRWGWVGSSLEGSGVPW